LIDAGADALERRETQIVAEQETVDGQHGACRRRLEAVRVVGRIDQVELALMVAVEPYRLLVTVHGQPVVEDPRARPKRRLAALERRPGDAESRAESEILLDVRHPFDAQAGAEREAAAEPDVVLHVRAALHIEVRDVRVADPPRVAPWRAGLVGLEAFEGVGPEVVQALVGAVPLRNEQDAGADRMNAAHVVEIRGRVDADDVASAGTLLPAAREGIVDGRRDGFEIGP
jgi:hypothetical protein